MKNTKVQNGKSYLIIENHLFVQCAYTCKNLAFKNPCGAGNMSWSGQRQFCVIGIWRGFLQITREYQISNQMGSTTTLAFVILAGNGKTRVRNKYKKQARLCHFQLFSICARAFFYDNFLKFAIASATASGRALPISLLSKLNEVIN